MEGYVNNGPQPPRRCERVARQFGVRTQCAMFIWITWRRRSGNRGEVWNRYLNCSFCRLLCGIQSTSRARREHAIYICWGFSVRRRKGVSMQQLSSSFLIVFLCTTLSEHAMNCDALLSTKITPTRSLARVMLRSDTVRPQIVRESLRLMLMVIVLREWWETDFAQASAVATALRMKFYIKCAIRHQRFNGLEGCGAEW